MVGYGSFALLPPQELGEVERHWLVALAARAIEHELRHREPYPMDDADVPDAVRSPGATFVTLERDGELQGCIGSLDPRRALWRDVARNARAAAFDDDDGLNARVLFHADAAGRARDGVKPHRQGANGGVVGSG